MHNTKAVLVSLQLLMLLASCKKSSDRVDTYFDSLVVAQVNYLSAVKPSVTKTATLDGKQDRSTFTPDSTLWENELDIYRQLSVFERPAYRDAYRIEDGVRDSSSNLVIRKYTAKRKIPVPELQFYYYHQFKNLKRMDAVYRQENLLYTTVRRLSLEFDEVDGRPVLIAYHLEGIQKMVLSDSVKFSIHTRITY